MSEELIEGPGVLTYIVHDNILGAFYAFRSSRVVGVMDIRSGNALLKKGRPELNLDPYLVTWLRAIKTKSKSSGIRAYWISAGTSTCPYAMYPSFCFLVWAESGVQRILHERGLFNER